MHQGAVDFLADPAMATVGEVVEDRAVGKNDFLEVAEHVIGVGGGLSAVGLGGQFTIGGVGIGRPVMGEESILIVDRGNGGAILLRSIAVGVIAIQGYAHAIPRDLVQPVGGIVAIVVGMSSALEGFLLLGDPTQGIADVGGGIDGCAW